jgi:hypothetical protein
LGFHGSEYGNNGLLTPCLLEVSRTNSTSHKSAAFLLDREEGRSRFLENVGTYRHLSLHLPQKYLLKVVGL